MKGYKMRQGIENTWLEESSNELKAIVGKNIVNIRKAHAMSRKELADILHVCESSIGTYERGETIPPLDTLITIANHFKISLDDLAGRLVDSSCLSDALDGLDLIGKNYVRQCAKEIAVLYDLYHPSDKESNK